MHNRAPYAVGLPTSQVEALYALHDFKQGLKSTILTESGPRLPKQTETLRTGMSRKSKTELRVGPSSLESRET